MLRVVNLVKRYSNASRGTFLAVDHLSFEVAPGEIYGLLGANGAGKTTTLRMCSTLIAPDSGHLLIDGITPTDDPLEVRRRLAYVPAESGLPDALSPLEVVTLFAQIQGLQRPQKKAQSLLEQLGATSWQHAPCSELSTGMKRRVVLARALIHEPQVLLLDEPTDGLDVQGRRDVLNLVRQQAKDGRAVVISSHIMGEVEQIVDRIGVIAQGKRVAQGTIAEVLAHTQTTRLDDAFLALTETRP